MPNNSVPFDQLPPDIKPGVINQCQSKACQDAKVELVEIRNRILFLCTRADATRSQRDAYAATAAALFTVAAAAAAVAIATGNYIAAIILWIIAAVVAIAGVIFAALAAAQQTLLAGTQADIADQQVKFQATVTTMLRECPEQCRDDATLPTCGGGGS